LTHQNGQNTKSVAIGKSDSSKEKSQKIVSFIITFSVMLIMWVIFSGKFDVFHFSLGVLSSLIVARVSSDLLIQSTSIYQIPGLWGRFFMYFPWLLWQIVLANLHLLKLVFDPDMINKINPQIIEFKSNIQNDMGLVTFANSITLTPGTITVSLSMFGDFKVHAIDDFSAEPLPGDMEQKVAKIFGE
jgi:multicomponent Na+:H+ antiporter subunit E